MFEVISDATVDSTFVLSDCQYDGGCGLVHRASVSMHRGDGFEFQWRWYYVDREGFILWFIDYGSLGIKYLHAINSNSLEFDTEFP